MSALAVVVLAAGKGTRMGSDIPKVLHRLAGKALIDHVLDTAFGLTPDRVVVVVGHQREKVVAELCNRSVEFAVQDPPMGTGHAVMMAESLLVDFEGDLVVLSGDVPLLRTDTLIELTKYHKSTGAAATVLSTSAPDPSGYGRIVRSPSGELVKIVEHKDAMPGELSIQEVNSGVYVFERQALFSSLRMVQPNNKKGEYYLTDVIGILCARGLQVQAAKLAEFSEVCGINTPGELEAAECQYLSRLSHMGRA